MRPTVVLFPEDGESWRSLVRRLRKTEEDMILVLTGHDDVLAENESDREEFLKSCATVSARLRIATKNAKIAAVARSNGIRVIESVKDLRSLLADHEQLHEALRVFSPHVWQQQLRSQLQATGLLSLPKLRVWALILCSAAAFFFVVFKLLPSATVIVTPHEDTVSHTANIFLVLSGATADIPQRVRTMELRPFTADITQSITYDQISKEFIGSNARAYMTVINNSTDSYGFRAGTRLVNQAGMVFRLRDQFNVAPGEEVEILALADDLDLFGEIIGDRGNVPAGVRWDFAGLAPEERVKVYAENRAPATGGTAQFRTVLHQNDIDAARKHLQSVLLNQTNEFIDEQIEIENSAHADAHLTRLYYDELTKLTFTGFVLPTQFIGERVATIPVEGRVIFTAYAYDANAVLGMLKAELMTHTEEGAMLVEDSVSLEKLVTHVIDYADDLSWIKLTVDLSGIERPILDPLTPSGAHFAMSLRSAISGKSVDDALRIIKNFPQVATAQVKLWPPWTKTLPSIPSHIMIEHVSDQE